MSSKSAARGIYYMLEPMLIMLMVVAMFAVPLIQNDSLENSRLSELQANDVMSVLFQTMLADRMVDELVKGCAKGTFSEDLASDVTKLVHALSPAYGWRITFSGPDRECQYLYGEETWSPQVVVMRTVILPIENTKEIQEGKLSFALLLPAPEMPKS